MNWLKLDDMPHDFSFITDKDSACLVMKQIIRLFFVFIY